MTPEEKQDIIVDALRTLDIQRVYTTYFGDQRLIHMDVKYGIRNDDERVEGLTVVETWQFPIPPGSLKELEHLDLYTKEPAPDPEEEIIHTTVDPDAYTYPEKSVNKESTLNYEWFYEQSRRENLALREIAKLYLEQTQP